MKKYLLQFGSGPGMPWVEISRPITEAWAKANGYEYVLGNTPKTGYFAHWERYSMFLDIWSKEPDAEIFWLDADCIIVGKDDVKAFWPDWAFWSCQWEAPASIWRSGVMRIRGCKKAVDMCTEILAKGPISAEKYYDDEARLNLVAKEMGVNLLPLEMRYNQQARHTPESVPHDHKEIRIAAFHGMPFLIKRAFMAAWVERREQYSYKPAGVAATGANICWYMRVCNDEVLARRSLGYLRANYPESELIIVDDGTNSKEIDSIGRDFNGMVFHGPKMYVENGQGKMWQNALETILSNGTAPWVCKIDTDTVVHGKMKTGFKTGAVNGLKMKSKEGKPMIQGGFIAFERSWARKVYEAKTLLNEFYNSSVWSFDGNIEEDVVISMALAANGAELSDYEDVGNEILHPVK